MTTTSLPMRVRGSAVSWPTCPLHVRPSRVLTHLPGLFYIAALNAITNSTSSILNRIFQVAVYNAIWYTLPVVALVLATHRPHELQDFLRRVTGWVPAANARS